MRTIFSNRKHYLYFIQVENSGPIKIGIAKDVKKRLCELQVGNPYELKILYFTPCCRKDEAEIHRILTMHNLHIRGEWFWPDNRLFDEIQDLKKSDARSGFDWSNPDPEKDLRDFRLTAPYWKSEEFKQKCIEKGLN